VNIEESRFKRIFLAHLKHEARKVGRGKREKGLNIFLGNKDEKIKIIVDGIQRRNRIMNHVKGKGITLEHRIWFYDQQLQLKKGSHEKDEKTFIEDLKKLILRFWKLLRNEWEHQKGYDMQRKDDCRVMKELMDNFTIVVGEGILLQNKKNDSDWVESAVNITSCIPSKDPKLEINVHFLFHDKDRHDRDKTEKIFTLKNELEDFKKSLREHMNSNRTMKYANVKLYSDDCCFNSQNDWIREDEKGPEKFIAYEKQLYCEPIFVTVYWQGEIKRETSSQQKMPLLLSSDFQKKVALHWEVETRDHPKVWFRTMEGEYLNGDTLENLEDGALIKAGCHQHGDFKRTIISINNCAPPTGFIAGLFDKNDEKSPLERAIVSTQEHFENAISAVQQSGNTGEVEMRPLMEKDYMSFEVTSFGGWMNMKELQQYRTMFLSREERGLSHETETDSFCFVHGKFNRFGEGALRSSFGIAEQLVVESHCSGNDEILYFTISKEMLEANNGNNNWMWQTHSRHLGQKVNVLEACSGKGKKDPLLKTYLESDLYETRRRKENGEDAVWKNRHWVRVTLRKLKPDVQKIFEHNSDLYYDEFLRNYSHYLYPESHVPLFPNPKASGNDYSIDDKSNNEYNDYSVHDDKWNNEYFVGCKDCKWKFNQFPVNIYKLNEEEPIGIRQHSTSMKEYHIRQKGSIFIRILHFDRKEKECFQPKYRFTAKVMYLPIENGVEQNPDLFENGLELTEGSGGEINRYKGFWIQSDENPGREYLHTKEKHVSLVFLNGQWSVWEKTRKESFGTAEEILKSNVDKKANPLEWTPWKVREWKERDGSTWKESSVQFKRPERGRGLLQKPVEVLWAGRVMLKEKYDLSRKDLGFLFPPKLKDSLKFRLKVLIYCPDNIPLEPDKHQIKLERALTLPESVLRESRTYILDVNKDVLDQDSEKIAKWARAKPRTRMSANKEWASHKEVQKEMREWINKMHLKWDTSVLFEPRGETYPMKVSLVKCGNEEYRIGSYIKVKDKSRTRYGEITGIQIKNDDVQDEDEDDHKWKSALDAEVTFKLVPYDTDQEWIQQSEMITNLKLVDMNDTKDNKSFKKYKTTIKKGWPHKLSFDPNDEILFTKDCKFDDCDTHNCAVGERIFENLTVVVTDKSERTYSPLHQQMKRILELRIEKTEDDSDTMTIDSDDEGGDEKVVEGNSGTSSYDCNWDSENKCFHCAPPDFVTAGSYNVSLLFKVQTGSRSNPRIHHSLMYGMKVIVNAGEPHKPVSTGTIHEMHLGKESAKDLVFTFVDSQGNYCSTLPKEFEKKVELCIDSDDFTIGRSKEINGDRISFEKITLTPSPSHSESRVPPNGLTLNMYAKYNSDSGPVESAHFEFTLLPGEPHGLKYESTLSEVKHGTQLKDMDLKVYLVDRWNNVTTTGIAGIKQPKIRIHGKGFNKRYDLSGPNEAGFFVISADERLVFSSTNCFENRLASLKVEAKVKLGRESLKAEKKIQVKAIGVPTSIICQSRRGNTVVVGKEFKADFELIDDAGEPLTNPDKQYRLKVYIGDEEPDGSTTKYNNDNGRFEWTCKAPTFPKSHIAVNVKLYKTKYGTSRTTRRRQMRESLPICTNELNGKPIEQEFKNMMTTLCGTPCQFQPGNIKNDYRCGEKVSVKFNILDEFENVVKDENLNPKVDFYDDEKKFFAPFGVKFNKGNEYAFNATLENRITTSSRYFIKFSCSQPEITKEIRIHVQHGDVHRLEPKSIENSGYTVCLYDEFDNKCTNISPLITMSIMGQKNVRKKAKDGSVDFDVEDPKKKRLETKFECKYAQCVLNKGCRETSSPSPDDPPTTPPRPPPPIDQPTPNTPSVDRPARLDTEQPPDSHLGQVVDFLEYNPAKMPVKDQEDQETFLKVVSKYLEDEFKTIILRKCESGSLEGDSSQFGRGFDSCIFYDETDVEGEESDNGCQGNRIIDYFKISEIECKRKRVDAKVLRRIFIDGPLNYFVIKDMKSFPARKQKCFAWGEGIEFSKTRRRVVVKLNQNGEPNERPSKKHVPKWPKKRKKTNQRKRRRKARRTSSRSTRQRT